MINDKVHYRSTVDVLMSHASVREFTDEPVNHDLLETLIEAGTRASTSSNMQAYTIISITEPERKKRITQLCADQKQITQSAIFLAFCADLHRHTLCTQMHDVSHDELSLTEGLMLAVVDTALVMENVAVAAESIGLGVCMIGALRNNPYQVQELLELPKHVVGVAGMCLGWPAKHSEPKPRLPLDAVWHREKYRCDEDLSRDIKAYDSILATFFESQGMRPTESRWSRIICDRLAGIKKRRELGSFIRDQGLNLQGEGTEGQ